ncbi:MAG: hypothetical protein HYR85_25200 [Planctomycetes bacterium]|nr:hypothetical protein [Planctomycetota bacterium]MBI3843315.1 hypothetical protein [Planctomycetota bacterium]
MIDVIQRVALCAASLFVVLLATSRTSAEPRDLRVRVTLNSGTKLEGVVRDGALYERLVDGQFVRTSSAEMPGAGFRLWQMNDSAGFFFVKYADIRDFKEIGNADAATEAAAEKALLDKKLADKAPVKPKPPETGKTIGILKKQSPPLTDAGASLLKKFPPQAGWTPEKKDQIEKRSLVIGAFPSPIENEWLDNYDKWRQAYDHWLAQNPDKAPKPQAAPPTTPKSGSKPSRSSSKSKNTGAASASADPSGAAPSGDDSDGSAKTGVDGRPEKERAHKTTKREEREQEKKDEQKGDDGDSHSTDDSGKGTGSGSSSGD